MIFDLSPLWGLLPFVIYLVLSFRDKDMIWIVVICVALGGIMTGASPLEFSNAIAKGLGSFLGLIGFIILLGSGLGEVLIQTGVAPTLVHSVMNGVGIKTQRQAILATMIASTLIVALLGTMAGGNAILAPILIPIMASLRFTPGTLGVLMHGAGAAGLFIGPFVPPVVTLLQLTKIDYMTYLIWAGIPLALIVWTVTFFFAQYTQKKTLGKEAYDPADIEEINSFVPTKKSKNATAAFLIVMVLALSYGIAVKAGAAFVIFVMAVAALVVGWVAGWKAEETLAALIKGGAKLYWLFFLFVLYDPFLAFIMKTGAFDAIAGFIKSLIGTGGSAMFMILSTFIGIFGVPGAAVAESIIMNDIFTPLLQELQFPPHLWATVLLMGSQITSFAYPTGDMLGQMGLARSKNLSAMLKNGLIITFFSVVYILLLALFYPF